MVKQHGKIEVFKEGPKVKIHLNLVRATIKKEPNWKPPYKFKKLTSIHD